MLLPMTHCAVISDRVEGMYVAHCRKNEEWTAVLVMLPRLYRRRSQVHCLRRNTLDYPFGICPQPLPVSSDPFHCWVLQALRTLEWKRFERLCAKYYEVVGLQSETLRCGEETERLLPTVIGCPASDCGGRHPANCRRSISIDQEPPCSGCSRSQLAVKWALLARSDRSPPNGRMSAPL